MNDMMTICKTTYTRVIRTRSLYVLLAAVLMLVGVTHLYADLTGGRQAQLMYDTGGGVLTLVGLFSALMVTFDIARDLREKVAMTLLSKPLGRSQYLLGKFCGIVWIMTVNLFILSAGVMLVLHLEEGTWRADFIKLAISTWGAMVMTTALGVMFASFLGELSAALLTLFVFVAGHATAGLYYGTRAFKVLGGMLPGFCLVNFKTELGNNLGISWDLIALAVAYALVYSAVLLSMATIFFNRRDIA